MKLGVRRKDGVVVVVHVLGGGMAMCDKRTALHCVFKRVTMKVSVGGGSAVGISPRASPCATICEWTTLQCKLAFSSSCNFFLVPVNPVWKSASVFVDSCVSSDRSLVQSSPDYSKWLAYSPLSFECRRAVVCPLQVSLRLSSVQKDSCTAVRLF